MPKAIIKFPETPPVWDSDLMATVDKELGPDFTDDPLIKRYNMFFGRKLQGKRYTLTMSSKDSTIYPGIATAKGALEQLEKVAEDHEIHGPLGGVERFKGSSATPARLISRSLRHTRGDCTCLCQRASTFRRRARS